MFCHITREIEQELPSLLEARCDWGCRPKNKPVIAVDTLQPPSESATALLLPADEAATTTATGTTSGSASDDDNLKLIDRPSS